MDTLRLWIGSGLAAFLILTSTWLRLRADEQLVPVQTAAQDGSTASTVSEAAERVPAGSTAQEEPAAAPLSSGPVYRPYSSYRSAPLPDADTEITAQASNQAELPFGGYPIAEFSVEEQAGMLPAPSNSAFAADFGMRGPAAIMEANNVEWNVPTTQDYVYTRMLNSQINTANTLVNSVALYTDRLASLQADNVSIGNAMVVLSESTENSPEPTVQTIETTVEVDPVLQEDLQPGVPQPIIIDNPEGL
jgi:hypothetical protein